MTSCIEAGPGDYVRIGREWKQIEHNTAHGAHPTPRTWTITTTDGERYGMWDITAYAKAEEVNRER